MALKIIDFGTDHYRRMMEMREEVLRKPLGLSLTDEDVKTDEVNVLIAAFDDDEMIGCCMLEKVNNDKNVMLRQMAVRSEVQGKGIGRVLMNFAEGIARDLGYREISMYARKSAEGFYEKLGYKTSGEEFIRLTIPHIIMKKKI